MGAAVVAVILLVFGTCLGVLVTSLGEVGAGIFDVAWSPDGTTIAYEADNGLWVVASDGSGTPRRIHPDAGSPLWAPNGRSLAVTTYDPGCLLSTLWVVELDSAEARHVADCVGGYDWSPTGQSLVVSDSDARVHVVDAKSGTKRVLLSTTGYLRGPVWAPDGQSIIFAGTPVGQAVAGLWAAQVDDGQPRLIAEDDRGHFIDQFIVAPDGRQMALLEVRDQPEAYGEAWLIVDSDGSHRRRVDNSDMPSWMIKKGAGEPVEGWWSPDGTELAGVAGLGTASQLWVQRQEGGLRLVVAER